jgi:deferrochelatase/peroxidase EfeB
MVRDHGARHRSRRTVSSAAPVPEPAARGTSRRRFLAAVAAGGIAGLVTGCDSDPPGYDTATGTDPMQQVVSFTGPHQAGIATPAPAHLVFTAFDLTIRGRAALRALMRRWTDAIAQLTTGRSTESDTGETASSGPAALTITAGVGPTLFDDRFALTDRRPTALRPLPSFRGERIDPAISGGDLMVQACAEDPMVALHAVRQLTRLADGAARVRWTQRGFGASAAARAHQTPRNLFGQKDGTSNPAVGTPTFDSAVWLPDNTYPAWLRGGSYAVIRKIRMNLGAWDAIPQAEQERAVGRSKDTGAPLSGGGERTAPDFATAGSNGRPVIDVRSHVRLAHPAFNRGAAMLRRGYSYDDGLDASTGEAEAGLFFIAYVADLNRQFIPIQRRLADNDRLAAFTTHISSSVFAVLPGVHDGSYLGQPLLV